MRASALSVMAAAIVGATIAISAQPVAASETGMAGIHNWRKVGKKTCLVDHDHSGSGSGPNRKVAELQAIRSWAGFTDLEYGSSWANFTHANNKRMSCQPSGGGFQCDLLAVPCRPF